MALGSLVGSGRDLLTWLSRHDMVYGPLTSFTMIETIMLHDHRFPDPPPRRVRRFIVRNWLPVTVVTAGVAIMTLALLGFSLIAWVGSALLAGFTMIFTLFALIRSRRQMDRLKKSVDVTLTHMSINRAGKRKGSRT